MAYVLIASFATLECRQGVVLGLSKVARLAKMFAKRFQDQQRFTCQVLEAFNAEVQPLGCAAIVEASHLGADLMPTKLTVASLGCFYAQPEVYMQVRWLASPLPPLLTA